MTTPDTMRGRYFEKFGENDPLVDNDILDFIQSELALRDAHHKSLRAKELGELKEKIRNMPKRNLGTIQYEEKYVRWNSFGREQGVDTLIDDLIEKPTK